MSELNYDWERLWCKLKSVDNQFSWEEGGFIPQSPDPNKREGVPFAQLAVIPCLILLGEPGIGKSTVLKKEYELLCAQNTQITYRTHRVDLANYNTEYGIQQAIFEHSDFKSWQVSDQILHLFVDSLDECRLRIDNIANILAERLAQCSLDRLFLRVACRPLDWPGSLQNSLERFWPAPPGANTPGQERVGVYYLAPLTQADVKIAAANNGFNPEVFWSEIQRKNVQSLTGHPHDLKGLLEEYREKNEFPATQAELYLKSCRRLCKELNKSRNEAGRSGSLNVEQRLIIAARIAALTVLTNRSSIQIDPELESGEAEGPSLKIEELAGQHEVAEGEMFKISEAFIREALGTSLFSPYPSQSPALSWTHRTRAEFLTSFYLMQNKTPLVQILSLLTHPDGKLLPQLYQVSTHLAATNKEVFYEILKTDPQPLLRVDPQATTPKEREALVAALLKLFAERSIPRPDWGEQTLYDRLAHPNLANQLHPYITDHSKNLLVRRVAIDIAEACQTTLLEEVLADLTLDSLEDLALRVKAAWAVIRLASLNTKAKFRPLVFGQAGNDPEDRLKGCGLLATWPHHLSAEELFGVLNFPKAEPGAVLEYEYFLNSKFLQHLQPSDLPLALGWLSKQPRHEMLPFAFAELMNTILVQAWEHLDLPQVLRAFGKCVIARLKITDFMTEVRNNHFLLPDQASARKRKMVVESVLFDLAALTHDSKYLLSYFTSAFLLNQDIPWLLELIPTTREEDQQLTLAVLIEYCFPFQDPSQMALIYYASEVSPVLHAQFARFIEPVQLDSAEAEGKKASYFRSKGTSGESVEEQQDRSQVITPPLKASQRIVERLNEIEADEVDVWWRLILLLHLDPDSLETQVLINESKSSLSDFAGWVAADFNTRLRIVKAAHLFIQEHDDLSAQWLESQKYNQALYGYMALRLLLKEEPALLEGLDASTWQKWITASLDAFVDHEDLQGQNDYQRLIKMAYSVIPQEFNKALLNLIDRDNRTGYLFILEKVECCWDERMAKTLLAKLSDETLKPNIFYNLLDLLLKWKVMEAVDQAKELIRITSDLTSKRDEQEKAVGAAVLLMLHQTDTAWSFIWSHLQTNPAFGEGLTIRLAYSNFGTEARITQQLAPDQLADFYIWLARRYPHTEEERRHGFHTVGDTERISTLKSQLLGHLVNNGTPQTCKALERVCKELPQLDWLQWLLLTAQMNTRRHTWQPYQPSHIIRLINNHQLRLIHNGAELLEAVCRSLIRLEGKFRTETPAVRDVWDAARALDGTLLKPVSFYPIDELDFSDYLKRHLEDDLNHRAAIINRRIVIKRESELRPSRGKDTGEESDIYLSAVKIDARNKLDSQDVINLIIEVKGCWNPGLTSDMQVQLVQRYLKDNTECQHGLYLIGWFNCPQWASNDSRLSAAPKYSLEEACKKFDQQAQTLSTNGLQIRAFVLDAALHHTEPSSQLKARAKRQKTQERIRNKGQKLGKEIF